MDLEGTRHEKAVLVVVSFIIGFTCGLIAFGLGNRGTEDYLVSDAPLMVAVPAIPAEMDAVPSEITGYEPPTENPPAYEDSTDSSQDQEETQPVSYEEGKLYANVGDERFLLSLRTDIMGDSNVEGFSTQGLHEALPAYSAAPSGQFVHFCEQQTAEPVCTHFVFAADTNTIYFVSQDGAKVITPVDEAMNVYWQGDTLTIGTMQSASVATPWIVTTLAAE
jgi:hypothetical protein